MGTPISENSSKALTAQEVVKALSYHGAFLKKHVISILRRTPGIIVNEEHPSDFGGKTRTLDILARDDNNVIYGIECKKVSSEKSWIFLKGVDQWYRVNRRWNFIGPSSTFVRATPPEAPVCSEGYEYRLPTGKPKDPVKAADQSPIFEAGGQLASAFLGFIQNRLESMKQSEPDRNSVQYYVPVLVTNARLFFINADAVQLNLDTGEVTSVPELTQVSNVILKQPIASPSNFPDFRLSIGSNERNQRFQESIYVINAKSLATFFAKNHREFLAGCADAGGA